MSPTLELPRFHQRLQATLAELEPELLRWYAADDRARERAATTRLALLRAAYRMSPEHHAREHRVAAAVAATLGLAAPIVLYRAPGDAAINAALFYVPDEIHVVLYGDGFAALPDDELAALLGHELAHYHLFSRDGGIFRTIADLVEASAARDDAAGAYAETALRLRRWTEVYADRGAALAAGALAPALALLARTHAGDAAVNVDDFLAQAREVVAALAAREDADPARTTHPEHAARALALAHWHAGGGAELDAALTALVDGATALEDLDLVQQRDAQTTTRAVLARVLAPAWMRTDATLAHARRFFPQLDPDAAVDDAALAALPAYLEEYVAYLLLDFAVVDPALGDVALAHAAVLARALGVRDRLQTLAKRELKTSATALDKLEDRAEDLFARAARDHAEGHA